MVIIKPKLITPNKITALLPHWPGLIQASLVNNMATAIPKADGLKICLPLKRKTYLDAMVIIAANMATPISFVFNSRLKPKADISTEEIPFVYRFQNRIYLKTISHSQMNWVARQRIK